MTATSDRFLVQLAADRWRAVDLADVYFAERFSDATMGVTEGSDGGQS